MKNQEIKEWLLSNLKANRKITVRWDCGGDEAFVYPSIDGEEVDSMDTIHELFEHFLIEKLNIPDAGEFTLTGKGTIFIEADKIIIEHSAEGEALIDYDEETEQEIYEQITEELTRSILFKV
jgi:hypothetical protein